MPGRGAVGGGGMEGRPASGAPARGGAAAHPWNMAAATAKTRRSATVAALPVGWKTFLMDACL